MSEIINQYMQSYEIICIKKLEGCLETRSNLNPSLTRIPHCVIKKTGYMDHFNVAYINESFEPCSARDYRCASVIHLEPGTIGPLHSTSKKEKSLFILLQTYTTQYFLT